MFEKDIFESKIQFEKTEANLKITQETSSILMI